MDDGSKFYKTAIAVIGCAKFPAGAYVSVKFSHQSENGTKWFQIDSSSAGKLDSPVMYPAHHLTAFVL